MKGKRSIILLVTVVLIAAAVLLGVVKYQHVQGEKQQAEKTQVILNNLKQQYGQPPKNDTQRLQTLKKLKAAEKRYAKQTNASNEVLARYQSYVDRDVKYFQDQNNALLKDNTLTKKALKEISVTDLQKKLEGIEKLLANLTKQGLVVYNRDVLQTIKQKASKLKRAYQKQIAQKAPEKQSQPAETQTSADNTATSTPATNQTTTNDAATSSTNANTAGTANTYGNNTANTSSSQYTSPYYSGYGYGNWNQTGAATGNTTGTSNTTPATPPTTSNEPGDDTAATSSDTATSGNDSSDTTGTTSSQTSGTAQTGEGAN
ncbi:hypothetical protein [Lacticaseibacillus rhamnosus]|uniref:hypothetical protein n=1 Tax=Lacticaseibacillus rhamnosus TaxID=47715 RepID=UPI002397B992|nr:hypothetical protein [Lacticaseibacillus rhamnosus]